VLVRTDEDQSRFKPAFVLTQAVLSSAACPACFFAFDELNSSRAAEAYQSQAQEQIRP
jgi:hypothetical protein